MKYLPKNEPGIEAVVRTGLIFFLYLSVHSVTIRISPIVLPLLNRIISSIILSCAYFIHRVSKIHVRILKQKKKSGTAMIRVKKIKKMETNNTFFKTIRT